MAQRAKSYLSGGTGVNLAALREFIRRDLLETIGSVSRGLKGLVIDPSLIGLLGLVAEFSALRERGVDKMYPLDVTLPHECPPAIVYLVRPDPALMVKIADHIRSHDAAGVEREYFVFFVPRRGVVCEKEIERLGVRGNIRAIGELQLNLIPLDSDVLSMELPQSFCESSLHGDLSSLHSAALAIMQLQVLFGTIPRVCGKGSQSKHIAEMLVRMRKEQPEQSLTTPEFESLVLIDRGIDLISVMCTQLTYEGLIDESYGIDFNLVELPPAVRPPLQNGKPFKAELNSGDMLYSEIRDLHFAKIGQLLSRRAKGLSAEYDERHDAKTVSQIKQFTSKLKRMQDEQAALRMHTDIATDINEATKKQSFLAGLEVENTFLNGVETDKVSEYIEDCVARKEPLPKVLRLMCLQSLTNNGLSRKVLDFYRTEILQTYGHWHLITLENLEKAGLLKLQEEKRKNVYGTLRKSFRLLVEEQADAPIPKDISYVYSGYAPLSIRVVEALGNPSSLRSLEEVFRLLPGPQFDMQQPLPPGLRGKGAADDVGRAAGQQRQPVTLVFFVGGCTFAEISALRFLGQMEGRDYVVATTKIVNGRSLLKSLSTTLQPPGAAALP